MEIEIYMTREFEKKSHKIFSDDSLQEMIDFLTVFPEKGDIIPKTGGIRKMRWKTGENNKGKSGGARVIYYFEVRGFIILLTTYSKSQQENISEKDKKLLKQKLNEFLNSLFPKK